MQIPADDKNEKRANNSTEFEDIKLQFYNFNFSKLVLDLDFDLSEIKYEVYSSSLRKLICSVLELHLIFKDQEKANEFLDCSLKLLKKYPKNDLDDVHG